jgi:hypothetical protein
LTDGIAEVSNVIDHPTPAAADPTGESFCFEKGAAKHAGGDGFADVWKRGFFGFEYKGKHKDLAAAYGWRADLTDEAILEQLLALNQAVASCPSHTPNSRCLVSSPQSG